MAGWWEDYKKRKGLSSGGSESRTGKTYTERITTDEHRQAAKSSTWWEDYKKKNDLERKAASDRQRAVQTASRLKYRSERNQRFASANRQLEENRSRDAAEDEIRELFRNPFSSDAEWQAGVLQRNAERYKRDLPLYQQAMQNSSTWGEYFSAHRQAGESQSAVKHQFERYQQAAQKAEQERNESNLVNRPAQWQAENLTPQEIEQRLAYYRSEAATPTVTDRDREEHAYLYPEAALKKVPHGARFDERLLEGAGQDAIDALYRPILTEQEKAAVEEADRQIIEEKASRNYEQVQRLLAAQAGQTEAASRARGNELIDEIAQGGEAANKAKTGKALFEQQQKKIDEESPTIIYGARGNYSFAMQERKNRGYILGSDWDNVPEDRKQAVYALFTESPEKAIELAKFYIADAQQAEDEERQAWYAQSGWTAALGLVSSAAAHLGAAVDPFGPVGQELTRYGDNALAGGSQWADAATGYQKIPEWVPIVGGKGAGDFYQTVGSVVQSAAVAAPAILAGRYDQAAAETIGKLGLALMGSSAAASDYRESVAAGMDEDRAKLHALAAGVEEALFEEVSLDKLIKMDTSGGLKAALKNWLVQSGVEGSEELATSIANRITDELISGAGQSKVERRASELIANGMSATQAKQQAESEWMTDTLYEGFSGFLSGGMMTGGNYALQGLANLKNRAVNAAETRKVQKQAGAAVSRSEGSVEALQAYAKDNGIEIKDVETAEQNAGESAEQGKQGGNQNSYSSRDYRSISETNSKVTQSIRNDLRGKTIQEQQTVRDSLVEKYGEGIAPVVNNAISLETASRVRQEYGSVDSIQAARSQAVKDIKDESLRRAVSDGYDSAAYSLAASQGGEGGMNAMSRYIQQRRNTGIGSEMSMNATVTAQDGSTKTLAITGMSEDGKRVSLANGSEVAVKDLQADADTTSAIQQLADLDLGADATKVLQAYQQSGVAGTEGYRWLMDYATAYNQGRTRQISLEQAAQRSSLDERTVMDAYTLGQQAANRETQAGLEKLKNLPKRKGANGRTANIDTTEIKGKTMSKSELEQFALANQYAQALGVDMKWFSSKEKDGKFVGKNGAYENGKIYMDIHAGRNFAADLTSGILATMGHELTHFQQQYAPGEYQAIKEFLFEQIVKSSPNGEARLERLIWEKQRRSGNTLSRKAAEDEVVADACQKMLRDSKAVRDFASQQPEAANGVVRWLDKWFKRVRSIFGRGGNYSEEAQIMDSLEQDVKAAFGELWDKALKQAAKVHDEVGNIGASAIRSIEETGASEQMAEEAVVQNSDRLDDETLRFLDNQEHVTVYRAMQMIDGKLYPPMAAKVEGKLVDATELGEWYQAVERPDLIDPKTGKWKLDKANGKAIKAAYNPYFHTSATPLNDQFSSAYKRPNIVVVEGIIPKSELTSGYKAQYAKDSVGETKWHAGPVASKLKGAKSRRVFLSRWFQAQRVVSDAEVADVVAKTLEGENIAVPNNVVTPSLLEALRERGVAIDEEAIDRFESKHGMRQNSDRDAEYLELAKDPEKNRARLQEMVDEAALKAGYTIKAYHGTYSQFTAFSPEKSSKNNDYGPGIYLTNDEANARGYAGTNGIWNADLSNNVDIYAQEEANEKFDQEEDYHDWVDAYNAAWDRKAKEIEENGRVLSLYARGKKLFTVSLDVQITIDEAIKILQAMPKSVQADVKEWQMEVKRIAGKNNTISTYAFANSNWSLYLSYALNNIGYSGIEDTSVNKKFSLFFGTEHYVIFNATDVKSADPVTYDDSGNVIPLSERFNEANEDIRFSERPNTDSTGRELSEGQQEYFKDSKILDKYGNLLTLYHGTASDFTVFDLGRSGKNYDGWSEYGIGIYLTPDKKFATYFSESASQRGGTPKLMELYANIKNPFNVNDPVTVDVSEYAKKYKLTEDDVKFLKKSGDRWLAFMREHNEDIYDFLTSHGYDGLWDAYGTHAPTQIVAFTENQVKNVDNHNPTDNPDIRYSERDYFDGMSEEQVQEELAKLQQEKATAREKQRSLEKTDEYKRLFQDVLDKRSPEAISAFNKWADESGYVAAVDRAKEVDAKRSEGAKVLDRLIDQRLEREEQETIQKSGKSEAEYFAAQAVKDFGYTPYFYDAGYIVPNGKMLNFSGQKGRHFGSRGQDHRAIGQIYAATKGSAAMNRFMNQGNVRIMAESPGIDISNATPLTKEQYATIRRFVNEARSDEYFNLDFSDERGNNLGSIEYEGRFTADRVLNDIRHFFETGEVRQPSGLSAFYSERDYSTPSDEELLMNAKVEDANNADQGRLLKDYQALGRKIATLEKQLAEAKRQTQLTNRALNTRGIGNVVKTVMRDYDITDARHNGTAKNATLALTDGYQNALDLLDKGASPATVNDAVYNGAVKAAEIILEQGTYSQNLGGKWQTYSASRYLGENSQELIDSFVSEAYADFVSNRYREARPETAADRLVARTKKEAQERVDKYKGRSDALAEANRRLEEKKTQAETEAKEARKAAGELFLEIKDLRQELTDNKTMSEQERKAASKKLKSLNKNLEAKRKEAANWQKRAKRNASLLKSALESKNRDISALNNRLSKEQAAALEKQKNLEAKLEKQIQRERDILAGKLRSPELVKMLKAEREKAEARVKEQKEQVFQNYKERKKASDLRGRIKNLSDEMKRRMTNPTDRAYVPASLYQSMTKLADVLDNVLSPNPGTKAEARYRAMMDAIRGMAREYEDVKNLDPVFASEYEQEISDAIGEIERILERKNASWIDSLTGDTQKNFAELNSDELQQLYDLMRQINYTITNATKVFGNSNYKSIFDAQRAVAEQQNRMKSLNAVSRLERKKRLRLLNSLSVMRATEMMAGWDRSAALYQLMHGIEQGSDAAWAWVMDYNKSMQDLKTGKNEKEYRQALAKQLDFGITDRDGLKVTMTKMQALQILMTAEREEHNDKLLHLQAGGAVIRNAIDLQNGKGAKARSQTISVTPELIQKINDSLTDWDRAYMKTVRDYFKREGKRTNEILYKLKHKVLKTEEFYVPYTVDRNYLEANLNEQQALNMWVKTPGSTNALKQKAKQPVIIDGMDTVMGQHVKEIGNYIGMAIPIRDFSKVYNGMIPTEGPNPLPVKETIERTFGKAGQHLLTQAVIDVQGGTARQNWESNISQFLNKLQGAFVRSALLINPSVTIKQAASYIAAESVISHLALERGNHSVWARTDESKSFMPGGLIAQLFARPEGKTAQRIYNEIDQHTSLHYQRRQGMSMAEIAEQANRTGPIKRRINAIGASMEQSKIGHVARRTGENLNPLTWIQRMDVATTAALWVACKEQAKLDKLAVGSEKFWKRTTELYERCIRETQPMYDGLHRTANQKQAGGLMQYLFPFRTVPIQNHGQLAASYEAYKAARESKNEAKIKEAGKFFRKTVWAQTESAFVFSVMTFLAAILKRKTKKYRDEEGEFDAGSFTKGLLTDVGSTLISVLNPMYGSELFNLGSRAVDKFEGNSGYTYDAFSVGVVDMINDLASSGDRLLADAGKIVRGENVNAADFWNHAMNLLVKGGKLAGIPADTVKTYFEGTKGNIQDAIDGRIPALNDESWERDAATNARRYLKAYLDNDAKKANAVLAELRSNLSKSGKDEAKINEAIRKAVSAQAIEKVADGTWTEEEAEAYLLSTGAYDDRENPQKDAWNAIRKGVAKSTSTDEEFNWKQYDDLAEAVANGEDVTGLLTEYRDHGYSDDQINAAIKSGIQEALTAGDLDGNEAADALIRYGVTYSKDGKAVAYDEQTAWKKVQEWIDKAEHTDEEGEIEDGYKYSAYADLFDAVDTNKNADGIIQTMVQNGGYDTDSLRGKIKEHLLERFIAGQITETALKNQLSRYCKISKADDANEIVANAKCKRDFGVYPDDLKEAFKDGDLSQNQAEKALQQYKGLSKADAQNRVQYWGYDGDLSENAWLKWNNELKGSGLSVDNWEKVYKVKSSAKGTDANGDGRADSGTVKAEVVSYIDSMNIPKSQKRVIYLAFGWAESTMPSWR